MYNRNLAKNRLFEHAAKFNSRENCFCRDKFLPISDFTHTGIFLTKLFGLRPSVTQVDFAREDAHYYDSRSATLQPTAASKFAVIETANSLRTSKPHAGRQLDR